MGFWRQGHWKYQELRPSYRAEITNIGGIVELHWAEVLLLVLQGKIEITLGEDRHELDAGDCLAMVLDRPITYRNPTSRPARYCVVIVAPRPV